MNYICGVCGYVYDEETIGIPFSEMPPDFRCPLCQASKSAFQAQGAAREEPVFQPQTEELKPLSPGQMAALCTNLARACEKQFKPEESALFAGLADWFTAQVPQQAPGGLPELLRRLEEDIAHYSGIRAVIDDAGDRGAARALVWGEKVTRMLSSLVSRYQAEGEALLRGTQVWVCTACGFVYIGQTPPERCPVCGVPADRFQMIEGRSGT